jgi:Uma2 family endonuclease
MTAAEFYDFCQANRDLRIERSPTGEVIVMPPAFSDTGNRNLKLAQQLANWADARAVQAKPLTQALGLPYPMARRVLPMPPGSA